MPMFDNPNKELQRLQAELLAEEDEELEELMEEYAEEDYQDFFQEDYEDEYSRETYSRSGRRKSIFDEIEDAFEEEEEVEEPFALFVEEKRGLFGRRKGKNKKKDSNKGLKVTLMLEVIALLCILIWWVVMKL